MARGDMGKARKAYVVSLWPERLERLKGLAASRSGEAALHYRNQYNGFWLHFDTLINAADKDESLFWYSAEQDYKVDRKTAKAALANIDEDMWKYGIGFLADIVAIVQNDWREPDKKTAQLRKQTLLNLLVVWRTGTKSELILAKLSG